MIHDSFHLMLNPSYLGEKTFTVRAIITTCATITALKSLSEVGHTMHFYFLHFCTHPCPRLYHFGRLLAGGSVGTTSVRKTDVSIKMAVPVGFMVDRGGGFLART